MKNKKTPGQVVVIITIFIAVIILLSIVLINIGHVSDIKTSTAQIADSGTLSLASQWSMYCNTLRDTMKRKAFSGFGCIGDETSIKCINWGLIIPLVAILFAIIIMPLLFPISLALVYVAINPLFTEVNAIMQSGFHSAAAQMTQYAAMRETSIEAMLEQAQFDGDHADRWEGDVFHYVLSRRWDPVQKIWIYNHYVYDLTESPVAASLKSKNRIPRYSAWYWSKRYPRVTEAGLTKEIKAFIDALLDITEFNTWDPAKWEYTEVSLKVKDTEITCGAGTCPDWAVPEKSITRILSHVSATEQNVIQDFLKWVIKILTGHCETSQLGFLPVKFIDLTNRLRNNPMYGSYITWTDCDIVKVTDVLRGMMVRDMELLNTPIAHRIPSINNWLPSWYNTRDHSQDIDNRLLELLDKNDGDLKGIREWLRVLRLIEPNMQTHIRAPYGENHYGLGNTARICNYACIKCCCDCPCECCGTSPGPCNREGIYCSACGGPNPPVCTLHDLYNTIPPWCPLQYWNPCYQACYCPDADYCHAACQFQGMLSKDAPSDPTEVAQAIAILDSLEKAILKLRLDIETFATKADAIMNPKDPAIIQLQKEAIYGWMDTSKPNRSSLNIVRVNLDNYPSRDVFPYIKEGYEWLGLLKVWTIEGQTNGPIGEVTVSRYTSDISIGSWWKLRYRKNPGDAEWPVGDLGGIVDSIHRAGTSGVGLGDFDKYAITSATKGNYGMRKENISIQRVK